MNKWTVTLSVALVAFGIVFSVAVLAQPEADDGPRYTNGTSLVRPDAVPRR